jgi:hypothetical protein
LGVGVTFLFNLFARLPFLARELLTDSDSAFVQISDENFTFNELDKLT